MEMAMKVTVSMAVTVTISVAVHSRCDIEN